MNLDALARKAAKAAKAVKGPANPAYGGAMEVEDMLRFALVHGAAGADEIDRLCAQHGWLRNGLLPDGTRVVPFACWAQACSAYGRGGVAALRTLLADPELASFAIAVLEEVKTVQSVQALLGFCAAATWQSPDATHAEWKALSALNLLLSLDDGVKADAAVMGDLLRVVVKAFDTTDQPFLKRLCLYAARGAPTAQTLAWLQQLDAREAEATAEAEVQAARAAAIKSIKRRLSPTYKAPDAKAKRQIQRARAADV